jgi:prepilin-type N-terminal cleavage/methylation domain-containing protein
MKFKKAGFTLIELLVVVLIIGILAAIALPQYQKAVEKSKITQAIILLKSLRDAQERYFYAIGKFTVNLLDLDIETPGIFIDNENHSYNRFVVKDLYFQLENGTGAGTRVASAYRNRNDLNLSIQLNGTITCGSSTNKYQKLCESLGKATEDPGNGYCPSGGCWKIEF